MSSLDKIPDWALWCASGLLVTLALWCLWRARLFDRSRGRQRCPKCWYDMAGVAGLKCPECGREAKGEKQLGRSRRSWLLAFVSVVMLAPASAPLWKVNWLPYTPSWLLLRLRPNWYADAMGGTIPPQSPLSVRIDNELDTRLQAKQLSPGQILQSMKNARQFRARKKWPAGVPYAIGVEERRVRTLSFKITPGITGTSPVQFESALMRYSGPFGRDPRKRHERSCGRIGILPPGTAKVICDISCWNEFLPPDVPIELGTWEFPVELVPTIEDAIPFANEEWTQPEALKLIKVRGGYMHFGFPESGLLVYYDSDSLHVDRKIGFGFRFSLWKDGVRIAQHSITLAKSAHPEMPNGIGALLNFTDEWRQAADFRDDIAWEVRLEPDPSVLLTEWDVEYTANLSGSWLLYTHDKQPVIQRK